MRYATHPAVAYTRLDSQEAVLLHLGSQRYFSLNETGVAIWDLLNAPRSLDEIVDALAETYASDRKTLSASVTRFVEELERDGLIQAATEAA